MSTTSPRKKNSYILFIFLLLALFFVSFLFFSRGALQSQLSPYGDFSFRAPLLSSLVLSPSRSDSVSPTISKASETPLQEPILPHSKSNNDQSKATELSDSNDSSVRTMFVDESGGRGGNVYLSAENLKWAFYQTPFLRNSMSDERTNVTEFFDGGFEESDSDNVSSHKMFDSSGGRSGNLSSSLDRLRGVKGCDLYVGTWVKDEDYPIYKPGSCPYVDEAYACQSNGRRDSEYMKWRWKPGSCDLPRFNATDFLVRLGGKRLMLVGDSMNRNQFESLLCLLRQGVTDKRKMYETHGHKITRGRGYYIFKFEDYNCTVEFVRSHFLVKEGIRVNAQGNSNPTLSIDLIDKTAGRWKWADILVFNTGHWWTHGKTARGKNYFKEGDHIYPRFDAEEAYRRALKTWAKWIDENINTAKLVFYRGYSSAHFRGGEWDSGGTCIGETEPILNGAHLDNYPLKMKIVEEVVQEMKFPVVLLNVTRLTNFRKDGHPSIYGKNVTEQKRVSSKRQDCSHWCLPGVPDAWNELIYATLVFQQSTEVTQTR